MGSRAPTPVGQAASGSSKQSAPDTGYQVEGICYLGTESPDIKVALIERRVVENTGHQVDSKLVRERYRWSPPNLRRTVEQFDQLEVLDNSLDGLRGIPSPVEQCCVKGGKVVSRLADRDMAALVQNLVEKRGEINASVWFAAPSERCRIGLIARIQR